MTQKHYFKATKANGTSSYDHNFKYKLGQNVHSKPDKKSNASCGKGIHLAKTIEAAYNYVPNAKELYLAQPGVILGEDSEKIRCASCVIIKKLTSKEIFDYRSDDEKQKKLNELLDQVNKNPLCGLDWIKEHAFDFTQEDFEKMTITISSDNHNLLPPISTKIKHKDVKKIIRSVCKI